MKVYLVGMPGSGKTTLGKLVADQLGVRFIDLDNEIEASIGKSISRIFAEDGEDFFRKMESRLLHQFAHTGENFIMATGGGAPCFNQGMDVINKTGLSVFLDVPVEELIHRIKNKRNRPLLEGEQEERQNKLLAIAQVRMACYKQAQVTLEKPTLDELLAVIHFQK